MSMQAAMLLMRDAMFVSKNPRFFRSASGTVLTDYGKRIRLSMGILADNPGGRRKSASFALECEALRMFSQAYMSSLVKPVPSGPVLPSAGRTPPSGARRGGQRQCPGLSRPGNRAYGQRPRSGRDFKGRPTRKRQPAFSNEMVPHNFTAP